jgi:LL-diaminopimelate aminotransferase
VDVIDLGAGDADLAPPPAAVEALARAADWMKERFGVHLDPFHELLPLIGSKEGIAHFPFAVLNPGEVAVIPDPGYQAYRGGVTLAGGEVHEVSLRPENDFLIPLRELPAGVRDRTRIVILNYPNNPTSAAAPRDYLEDAVAFCREHDAVLVHDHAYSEIAFDGYRPPSILEIPGAMEVAVEFHSFSKTYNMTGWRLGWAAGNRDLIAALSRVKGFLDTGVFKAVQAAGLAALQSYHEWVPGNVAVFQRRRDAAVESFRAAGFDVEAPSGTMYLWIPVPGTGASREFTRMALERTGVIVIPGAALGQGGEGFFRVALTVPEARLREAADRLSAVSAG